MTDVKRIYGEHLKAMLRNDPEEAQRWHDQLPDGSLEGTGRINIAVLSLVLKKRFSENKSHDAILAFVADFMNSLQGSGQQVNPLHAELLVRSVLGESALFAEVPGEVANLLMPLLAVLAADQSRLDAEDVNELVEKAIQKAA
ncbi:hypothetical protein [Glycomyces salinus]|uniref:hypothetical protein n=1 Tax=Glycomyces salinus TaxID=980294 RepID=UPI0018EAAE27|nr:hypothetical protein [Glycomyces salinus]